MNILKEKIKLAVSYPTWYKEIRKIEKSREKKIFLFGTPVHGNLGDHAIALQEEYFFQDFFPDYEYFEILMPLYHVKKEKIKKLATEEDLIVISGGGWMGNLWLHNENVIREIIEEYQNNKVVILPQTVYYTFDEFGIEECKTTKEIFKKHNDLHIFVREKQSYDFIKQNFDLVGKSNVYLAPDMVLYGKGVETPKKCDIDKKNINICLRKDCESKQENITEFLSEIKQKYNIKEINTIVKSPVPLKQRRKKLKEMWTNFANSKVTITDRLHAMLFSVLNGTPCIVLDNKTGKVFGVAEWLDDTNLIDKAASLNEVFEKIEKTSVWKHQSYDRKKLLNQFENMAEVIRED